MHDPASPSPAPDAPEDHGLPALTPDRIEQNRGEQIDDVVPGEGSGKLRVVGLGGSAGGLAALQAFFGAMPPDSGMAFVVIYLHRDAQERAVEIFHYALHPEGVLFLGSPESADDGSALFAVMNTKFHLDARRTLARPRLPTVLPGPRAQTQALSTHHRERIVLPKAIPVPARAAGAHASGNSVPWSEVHARSVEVFGPPSVIVSRTWASASSRGRRRASSRRSRRPAGR